MFDDFDCNRQTDEDLWCEIHDEVWHDDELLGGLYFDIEDSAGFDDTDLDDINI